MQYKFKDPYTEPFLKPFFLDNNFNNDPVFKDGANREAASSPGQVQPRWLQMSIDMQNKSAQNGDL